MTTLVTMNEDSSDTDVGSKSCAIDCIMYTLLVKKHEHANYALKCQNFLEMQFWTKSCSCMFVR